MAIPKKSKKENLPFYLYKISKSGPNRLHIEIPSRDRQKFKAGGIVAVIPYDQHIQESLEKVFEINFDHSKERTLTKWWVHPRRPEKNE
jgi:hypothetical protein